jgi:hypothetical protein
VQLTGCRALLPIRAAMRVFSGRLTAVLRLLVFFAMISATIATVPAHVIALIRICGFFAAFGHSFAPSVSS